MAASVLVSACGGGGGGPSGGPTCIATHEEGCLSPAQFEEKAAVLAGEIRHRPDFFQQWGLAAIKADEAYAHLVLVEGADVRPGEGQTIGIIDSGIDETHPVFEGTTITEELLQGASDETGDEFSHGTAVASVIAAPRPPVPYPNVAHGVAWGADLAVFAISFGNGSGARALQPRIARGSRERGRRERRRVPARPRLGRCARAARLSQPQLRVPRTRRRLPGGGSARQPRRDDRSARAGGRRRKDHPRVGGWKCTRSDLHRKRGLVRAARGRKPRSAPLPVQAMPRPVRARPARGARSTRTRSVSWPAFPCTSRRCGATASRSSPPAQTEPSPSSRIAAAARRSGVSRPPARTFWPPIPDPSLPALTAALKSIEWPASTEPRSPHRW